MHLKNAFINKKVIDFYKKYSKIFINNGNNENNNNIIDKLSIQTIKMFSFDLCGIYEICQTVLNNKSINDFINKIKNNFNGDFINLDIKNILNCLNFLLIHIELYNKIKNYIIGYLEIKEFNIKDNILNLNIEEFNKLKYVLLTFKIRENDIDKIIKNLKNITIEKIEYIKNLIKLKNLSKYVCYTDKLSYINEQ